MDEKAVTPAQELMHRVCERLNEYPVIAAVHDADDIEAALQSEVNILFLMHGDIFEMQKHIDRVRECGKFIFVHADLVKGISRDDSGIRYYARTAKVHGIISTNGPLLRIARSEGLLAILRMFLVDARAFQHSIDTIGSSKPDFVEVMPALVPRAIQKLGQLIDRPLIAGGMVTTKDDIISGLKAGAMGMSTSMHELWQG